MPFLTDTYVLFVGGRAGYKNFQLVVDAIFETSLNLVIVGGLLTGKERFYLEEKLGSRYKYVGNIFNFFLNILYFFNITTDSLLNIFAKIAYDVFL